MSARGKGKGKSCHQCICGGNICYSRCPLMCEVKRSTDGQNTLKNPRGKDAVGQVKFSKIQSNNRTYNKKK
jgi:hypothetical protein